MPSKPRYVPPNATVEVMIRTVQGRMLLCPSAGFEERVLGVLGRAQHLYPVQIHAFVFLSNHAHMLLTVRDGKQLSDFLKHLNKNVTEVVQDLTGWEGSVWARRPSVIEVLDDDAAMDRLRYIHANGVKEGLVDEPTEWPGVTSARALLHQNDIVTTWQGKADRLAVRRAGPSANPNAYRQVNRIRLVPLRALAGLSKDERKAWFAQSFRVISHQARITRDGKPSLGRAAIVARDPREPVPLERRRAPIAHASTRALLAGYRADLAAFVARFEAASVELSAGRLDVPFPHGSFPPRRPFVAWPLNPSSAAPSGSRP